jgi:mRNA interferase RelE/StbE
VKAKYRKDFLDEVRAVPQVKTRARIEQVLLQVESVNILSAIPNIKKIQGYESYFRIRVGDYRIGFRLEGDTVVFMRCLNRRDIYRLFP